MPTASHPEPPTTWLRQQPQQPQIQPRMSSINHAHGARRSLHSSSSSSSSSASLDARSVSNGVHPASSLQSARQQQQQQQQQQQSHRAACARSRWMQTLGPVDFDALFEALESDARTHTEASLMWKLLARRLPVNSYLRRRPAPSSSSSSSSPSPAPPAVDHALDTAMPAPAPASFSALPAATGVMAELPHTLPLPLHVNVSPAIPAPSRSAAVQHDRQTAPAATPTETAAVATAVAATAAAAARPSTPDRSSPLPAALCVEPFHSCQRCHAPLETIEHVFFECPAIASFWPAFRKQFLAVIGMSDAEFPAIDLRAVVFFFPETRNALCAEELHALQVMHSIAIWCLWSVRSMTDADPRFIWSSFLSRLHARISLEYSNAIAADDTAITAIPSPTLSSAPSAEMRVSGAFSLSQSTLTVGAGRDDSPPASPTASQLSSVGSVWSSYSQSAAMSVAAKRRLSPTYGTIGVSAPGNPRQHRSRSISANSAILPPLYESPYDHQQSSSQIQDSQHHYQHHQLYSQSSVSSSQLSLSPSQYSQLSISPSRSFMYPHAKKTLPGSRPSSVQSHSQLSRFIATWSNNGSTPIVAITQTGLAFRAVPSISV